MGLDGPRLKLFPDARLSPCKAIRSAFLTPFFAQEGWRPFSEENVKREVEAK